MKFITEFFSTLQNYENPLITGIAAWYMFAIICELPPRFFARVRCEEIEKIAEKIA